MSNKCSAGQLVMQGSILTSACVQNEKCTAGSSLLLPVSLVLEVGHKCDPNKSLLWSKKFHSGAKEFPKTVVCDIGQWPDLNRKDAAIKDLLSGNHSPSKSTEPF